MKKILLILAILIGIIGCNGNDEEDLRKNIEEAEAQLKEDTENDEMNKEHVLEAAEAYERYLEKYPGDSVAPNYMARAASLYADAGEFPKAVALSDSVQAKYPDSEMAPYALHLKAYKIYELGMSDLPKAEEAYHKFLMQYPEHELVSSVLFSLEHLGKSDEDILREIKKKTMKDTLAQ